MIIMVVRHVAEAHRTIAALTRVEIRLSVAGDDRDFGLDQDARIDPRIIVSNNGTGYPRIFVVHAGRTEFAAYSATPEMAQEAIRVNAELARRAKLQEVIETSPRTAVIADC